VMEIDEELIFGKISTILEQFSKRQRNITRAFNRHCSKLKPLFSELNIDYDTLTVYRKLYIGYHFTVEYPIESFSFFNPSIIKDPVQEQILPGQARYLISMRSVGENHISSIIFRRILIDKDNNLTLVSIGPSIDEAEIVRNAVYNKKLFFEKALIFNIDKEVIKEIESKLDHHFEYANLKKVVNQQHDLQRNDSLVPEYDRLLWLADSYYEIVYSLDTDISDRVIYPIAEDENMGIEDARFTNFKHEDGTFTCFAIFTGYDGSQEVPKLLQTNDFYNFKILPLYGSDVKYDNLVLFPRKINEKYVMIGTNDQCTGFIMYSDQINIWEKSSLLYCFLQAWEFLQIGYCGSPLETEDGWILITHGIDAMKRYVIGASLLKLDDPSVEVGRLKRPLLLPNNETQQDYVRNLFGTCGSILINEKIIIPYGCSDSSVKFLELNLPNLINDMLIPYN